MTALCLNFGLQPACKVLNCSHTMLSQYKNIEYVFLNMDIDLYIYYEYFNVLLSYVMFIFFPDVFIRT